MQEFDDGTFPIAYASRKLHGSELNYGVMEKEGLVIVFGIKKFENYLYANEFILQTDHRPLTYLNSKRHENSRILRWSLLLQRHRFKLRSVRGTDNVAADYLNRIGEYSCLGV